MKKLKQSKTYSTNIQGNNNNNKVDRSGKKKHSHTYIHSKETSQYKWKKQQTEQKNIHKITNKSIWSRGDQGSEVISSVKSLPNCLKWNSLHNQCRLHNQLQRVYEINNRLVNINFTSFCQSVDPRTRGTQLLRQQHTNHSALFNSFFPYTIRDWNLLPVTTISATYLQSFKNQLGGRFHNLQQAPTAP